MKIAVLGATGPSGIQVVKEALERGHDVTAIVRNPGKLVETHEHLKVVEADIFDSDSLEPHFEGQDAVLSCLGCGRCWFGLWSVTIYTASAKAIVTALRRVSVKRFICVTSWYTKHCNNVPFIFNWIIKPLYLGQILKNMGHMEDYLDAECPDIEYTSVRPPYLTNAETTGVPVLFHEGLHVPSDKDGVCSRRDLARFMLDTAENGKFIRKCIAIASGRPEKDQK